MGSFNQSGSKQEGDDPENLMGAVVSLICLDGVNKIGISKHMPNLMVLLADFQGFMRNNKNFYKDLENQLPTD